MIKDWNKIGVFIGILTLILVGYQTFISQPNTDRTLQQIASNTFAPKPIIYGSAQCYLMEPDDIQKYLSLNYTKSYYGDVFTLHVTGAASASNPWMKIMIPEGIEYYSITNIPEGTQTINKEILNDGGKQTLITVSWNKLFPPESNAYVVILYDREYSDALISKPIYYFSGSTETTGYTIGLNCYSTKLFTGFQ